LKDQSKSTFNKLNVDDLDGRILLLNVYKISDTNNIFSLQTATKVKNFFKNKITILDIITDGNDFDSDAIKDFVIKNDIERPIFDIPNFIDGRIFLLIDKDGEQINVFKDDYKDITKEINTLLTRKKMKAKINPLSVTLEKRTLPEPFIKSLSFIKRWNNKFILGDPRGGKIFIVNINGEIINQIGNFCYPLSFSIKDNVLYIPDFCDNLIKSIDLDKFDILENVMEINQPIAVNFLDNDMIVSTSNGIYKGEDIICNDCDKVFKLDKNDSKLFFVNKGEIKFFDKNFTLNNTDIETDNSNNIYIDETGIFIADRFNNKIVKNKKVYSESSLYNFPTDIVDYRDKLYITNENNKEILILDKITKKIQKLPITFSSKYNNLENDEYLYVNNDLDTFNLKTGSNNKVLIKLEDDYVLEKFAHQSISLFKKDKKDNAAILLKKYNKQEILKNEFDLPELSENEIYYLNGSLLYRKNNDTRYFINNFTFKIETKNNNIENIIEINFLAIPDNFF
jgi:hypothetical protein